MLGAAKAGQIIDEVRSAMTMTRQVARQCGISDREMERFFRFMADAGLFTSFGGEGSL